MSKSKPMNKSKEVKIFLMHVLVSIPLAFALMKVIEYKYTTVFWSYFAIMGISAIIADWNDLYESHTPSTIAGHLAVSGGFTLFICWFLIAVVFK